MKLLIPATVEEAVALAKETNGAFLAGGTVTMVAYHRNKPVPETQISLERLDALKTISLEDGVLRLGALVTMDEIENSALVKEHARALSEGAMNVGGPQVRNRATLGGNIAAAAPASDCAAPLLALNASLRIVSPEGERTVPVREFLPGYSKNPLGTAELVTAIEIPVSGVAASAFMKAGKRNAMIVSSANLAVARYKDGTVAVAAGAVAPRPVYCEKTSAALSADPKDLLNAGRLIQDEIRPIDDRWATEKYRRAVIRNLLAALMEKTEANE